MFCRAITRSPDVAPQHAVAVKISTMLRAIHYLQKKKILLEVILLKSQGGPERKSTNDPRKHHPQSHLRIELLHEVQDILRTGL